MSEACVSTARAIIWLTRRITGASLARSFSRSASSASQSPPSAGAVASASAAAISGYSRASAASSSIGTAASGATARPVAAATAACVNRSRGSAIARCSVPLPISSGSACAWRRNFAFNRSTSSGSAG